MFLAKVGDREAISKYHKDQTIFAQGRCCGYFLYIQEGKVKTVVISERDKEAVVAVLEQPDQ